MTAEAVLEPTACPMCGADDGVLRVATPDFMYPSPERFRLLSCRRCGHLYQNPRPAPNAIDRYYPPGYLLYLEAIDDDPSWFRRVERRRGRAMRCNAVHRAAGNRAGRLLDVGCATGIFLDGMRQKGWQVQGVEPVERAASYARSRFGLDVFGGMLEDAALPAASFDAITMWDVLEHVHEPRQVLAELARLLRPGGVLVLGLPNPDSFEAHLFGPFWQGWDLPRHLNLYRPTLLRAHLARYGMPVERISSFTAGYAVMALSLERRMRAAGRPNSLLLRVVRSLPVRLLAKPYYSGPASWYNWSSIMVVFARRAPAK